MENHITCGITIGSIYDYGRGDCDSIYFFRGVIEFLNSLLGGLQYLIYLCVPWIISGVILKLNPDGQKLHWYLFDLGKFMFLIFLPKKKFCQDEVVHLPKKVVFQKYEE